MALSIDILRSATELSKLCRIKKPNEILESITLFLRLFPCKKVYFKMREAGKSYLWCTEAWFRTKPGTTSRK